MRRTLSVFLLLCGLLIAACSSDSDSQRPASDTSTVSDTSIASDTSMSSGDSSDADSQASDASDVIQALDICEDPDAMSRLDFTAMREDPSYGARNAEQFQRMIDAIEAGEDGPFFMINLVKFKALAEYADGRETDLTGREADALYAPLDILSEINAEPVWAGDVEETLIANDGTAWDQVAIVRYPCRAGFFAMAQREDFQARHVHKDAGVEKSIVMVAALQPSVLPEGFEPTESPFPATADDPPFEIIHVLNYNDIAEYEPDANEPERTSREAMSLYEMSATGAALRLGVYPTAWFVIEGVFLGDGRVWDEVRLNHMQSRATFDALVADPDRLAGQHHREAALEDTYSLVVPAIISAIPGAPEASSGGTVLPIASDGSGTLCMDDSGCSGLLASSCISPDGTIGFCSIEGCSAGQCADGYLCCHDCNPALASLLPFEGSACFPTSETETLTGAPACTCD